MSSRFVELLTLKHILSEPGYHCHSNYLLICSRLPMVVFLSLAMTQNKHHYSSWIQPTLF